MKTALVGEHSVGIDRCRTDEQWTAAGTREFQAVPTPRGKNTKSLHGLVIGQSLSHFGTHGQRYRSGWWSIGVFELTARFASDGWNGDRRVLGPCRLLSQDSCILAKGKNQRRHEAPQHYSRPCFHECSLLQDAWGRAATPIQHHIGQRAAQFIVKPIHNTSWQSDNLKVWQRKQPRQPKNASAHWTASPSRHPP